MHVRIVLPALVLTSALLHACGNGASDGPIEHPRGADQVVLRMAEGAGMTTRELAFATPPRLVVTGDRSMYLRTEESTMTGIVWPMVTRRLSEDELQTYLHRAQEDDLLQTPPDYTPPTPVMDAGDTTVTVTADGGRWTHRANALGDLESDTAARERLADFVAFVGRAMQSPDGPRATGYRPDALMVTTSEMDLPPQESRRAVAWPSTAGIRLRDVGGCAVVRDSSTIKTLTTRPERTYTDDGSRYVLFAVVLLPGGSCSPYAGS